MASSPVVTEGRARAGSHGDDIEAPPTSVAAAQQPTSSATATTAATASSATTTTSTSTTTIGGGGPTEPARPARVRMNLLSDAMASDRRGASLRTTIFVTLLLVPQIFTGVVMLGMYPSESCAPISEADVALRTWIAVDLAQKLLQILVSCGVSSLDARAHAAIINGEDPLVSERHLDPRMRYLRLLAFWVDIFGVMWVMRGSTLFFTDLPCSTAPHLFPLGKALISLSIIMLAFPILACVALALAVCFCLPCLMRAVVAANIANRKRGATPDVLATIETRVFQPGMFATSSSAAAAAAAAAAGGDSSGGGATTDEDATAAPSCAICLSAYEPGDEVCVLPCGGAVPHHYHKSCGFDWLTLNASCPVCRHPVGAASSSSPPPAAAVQPSPSQQQHQPRDVELGLS